MNWKRFNLVCLTIFALVVNINATNLQEFTKEMEETFTVAEGSKLQIVNKYGNIHLDTWNKNEVNIAVTIKVKTSSQSKADQIFEIINISLGKEGNKTYGITELNEHNNNSGWWDRLFSSYESGNYEIIYKVKFPASIQLDITNKYGHIYHNNPTTGDVEIENKYGNIYAADIEGDLEIDLGYGDAKLGNAHNVKMDVKYSNIKLGDAKNVVLDTKYSEIEIGHVLRVRSSSKYDEYTIASAESLENEGKYDDFRIGSLGSLEVDAKYSTLKIDQITRSAEMIGKHNTLQVKDIANSTDKIYVEGEYVSVKIKMPASFELDLAGEYLSPKIPVKLSGGSYIKDDEDIEISGTYGSGNTYIKARMEYGSFKMLD